MVTEDKRKFEKVENPDPHWVRDTLIEDLKFFSERAGVEPDLPSIERDVQKDLAEFQAREREKSLPKIPGLDAPGGHKEETDLGVYRRELQAQEDDTGHGVERWTTGLTKSAALARRIQELCRLHPDYRAKIAERRKQTFENYARGKVGKAQFTAECFLYPAPASEIMSAHLQCKYGKGEFKFLSEVDRDRLLQRKLEDVADRSTAIPGLGAWWVR